MIYNDYYFSEAQHDATPVKRLRDMGAVLIGTHLQHLVVCLGGNISYSQERQLCTRLEYLQWVSILIKVLLETRMIPIGKCHVHLRV